MSDRIWKTYKTRMHSEKRYRLYDRVSHLMLSYYTLCLISYSIVEIGRPNTVPYFDVAALILTVLIFACSLIVWGFQFAATANSYRDCYLELQQLYFNFQNTKKDNDAYVAILRKYPNHSDRDYQTLLILQKHYYGEPVTEGGKIIPIPRAQIAYFVCRWIFFWFSTIAVFGLPLAPAAWVINDTLCSAPPAP